MKAMKTDEKGRILAVAVLLAALLTVLSSCSPTHSSTAEITKEAENSISEKIVYDRSEESGDTLTICYRLPERNGEFTVVSTVSEDFGEHIENNYERDIMEFPENIEKRAQLARQFGVDDTDYKFGAARIEAGNYEGIDAVVRFILALDELYAFRESDQPKNLTRYTCGTISFSAAGCSTVGVHFSTSDASRLTYAQVFGEIERNYVIELKHYGFSDDTLPEEVRAMYEL